MALNNSKASMSDFFTREKANNGIKVPLFMPNGSMTDQWLLLRGVDSDEFRLADVQAKRDAVRLAAIPETKDRDQAIYDLTIRLTAVLVADWSFDEECTLENVINFFKEAPQIAHAVDVTAGDRGYFFTQGLSSSSDSQDMSSSLTKSRKGANKVSAPV